MSAMAIAALAMLAGSAELDGPLRLSCSGRGTATSTSSAWRVLASGALSTTRSTRLAHPEARLMVEVKDGAARVRLPPALVTAVNSGGEDGWWTATELKITDETITGRLRLNLVNKPGFRIDRLTGDIELGGAYPFTGTCEKAESVQRKF